MLSEVLARGDLETGSPHLPGSIRNGIDCAAVLAAAAPKHGKCSHFPYRGIYRAEGFLAASLFKVAAHEPEFVAKRDGWHHTWKLNDTVDWLAKRAVATRCGEPDVWKKDRRGRLRLLQQLLGSLGPESLWAPMCRNKPETGRHRATRARKPMAEHRLTFSASGRWVCLSCGASFTAYGHAAASSCPGLLPAARCAHRSHLLYTAAFVEPGGRDVRQPIVFCARCGAHGTSRVANLAVACPLARGTATPGRHAPCRKAARLVAKLKHPSRKGVDLLDPRPLKGYGADNGRMDEVKVAMVQPAAAKRKSDAPLTMEEDPEAGDALDELRELELAAQAAAEHGGDLGHEGFVEEQDEEEHQLLGDGWGLEDGQQHPQQPTSGDAVPAEDEDAGDREEPDMKRPRNSEFVEVSVAASLDGIEARLQARGETPRFKMVRAGLLQHSCTTADATVNFWPSTLVWSVEGRQHSLIEDALLAPTGSRVK